MTAAELLGAEFGSFADLLSEYAREQPRAAALVIGDEVVEYASLDAAVDRVAAALQRDGFASGDVGVVCVGAVVADAVIAFLGILRAGGAVAPLPAWLAPPDLAGMLADSGAAVTFLDPPAWQKLGAGSTETSTRTVVFDGASYEDWLGTGRTPATRVVPRPEQPFNIIYSSGTTGRPKGIVLSHGTRWAQLTSLGYDRESITLVSLSLYSNMALLSLLPTLAHGATVVLMPKFDAEQFLLLAQRWRVTHAMLVPVQVRRILDRPDFDSYDLSAFRLKLIAGSPSSPALLAEMLRRWPGGLVQTYGLTEGGGGSVLVAHEFPDKLHTVGRPGPRHQILILDELERPLPVGEIGEVVGRSPAMMLGYLHQPKLTAEIRWVAPDGQVFLRSGDLGRIDDDGFLELVGRKKEVIISGGFNLYASDLENQLMNHPQVYECSVIGVPSERWGETPVAYVVPRVGASLDRADLLIWFNARVGKNQRLADLQLLDALPRNDNGKVVKRELRKRYSAAAPDAVATGGDR